jgi:transposase-like protein
MEPNFSAQIVRIEDHRPGKPRKAPKARKPRKTLAERLAEKVDTSGGPDACHPFTACRFQSDGYGAIRATSRITGKQTMRSAHVVAFEIATGAPVPAGMLVLHARGCDKRCCRPDHLRLGTQAENMADAVAEKRLGRRLTKAEVLEIVYLHQQHGVSAHAIANRFGIDRTTVRNIFRGQTWSKLTGIERNRGVAGRQRKAAAPAPAQQRAA